MMHCVHLGVAQHVGGNVLYELVYNCLRPVGTVSDRLREVWASILEFYSMANASSRIGALTLAMLIDTGGPHQHYPCLRTKAKETEWLCRALAFVWTQWEDTGNRVHQHISKTLDLLIVIFDIAKRPSLDPSIMRRTRPCC
jgi:hypothetical protein